MIPSTEFVPAFNKTKSSGREELRFMPKCSECGEVVLNVAEANLAVIEGAPRRLKRIGTHNGTKLFQDAGWAVLLCWICDRAQERNHVPWQNALATFRGLDEPQRYPEIK